MAARKKTSNNASKPETDPKKSGDTARKAKSTSSARSPRTDASAEKKPASAPVGSEAGRAAKSSGAAETATAVTSGRAPAAAKGGAAAKPADPALKPKAPEPSASAGAGTPGLATPKPVETPAAAKAGAAASARGPVVTKESRAPSSTKTNERDEQGEQKIMKNTANRNAFKLNEFVVYPAHGVGQIVAMEEQEVAGFRLELFVINFTKDKMTLRVPTAKVTGVGMRKLSEPEAAHRSLEILTGRARIKRTMWSRRAQEYEAKINSGDINAIAEVVRDLYRSEAQPEQSYSERQLYEAALDRMMREIAAVQKLTENEALKVIEAQLMKNQKRAAKPEAAEGEERDVEEAA